MLKKVSKSVRTWAAALLLISSCGGDDPVKSNSETGKLIIKIEHFVGNEPFLVGENRYKNKLGQAYNVEKLDYYLSNFRLRNLSSGLFFSEKESYHLLRNNNKGSILTFEIDSIPLGSFSEIEFAIGIDNAHNTSIDRDGDLDPSNNMAWDWNTGYKFVVMEGLHYTNTTDGEPLIFHIGEDKNYKTLKFRLDKANELRSEAKQTRTMTFRMQVDEMFTTPTDTDFKTISKVSGGAPASEIANNYATGPMFQFKSVE